VTARGSERADALLVGVGLVVAAAVPLLTRDSSAREFAATAAVLGGAATALALPMAAGVPSLAQGAFIAVGLYVTASLRVHASWGVASAVMAAVVASAATGAATAAAIRRVRPAFAALVTWIAAWCTTVAIAAFPALTGGAAGLVLPPVRFASPTLGLAFDASQGWLVAAAAGAAALVVGVCAAVRRRFVPALDLIAADPAAARAVGLPVARLRTATMVAAAAAAGFLGAVLALVIGIADPTAVGIVLSAQLFLAVLVGGSARLAGPAIGLVALLGVTRAASVTAHTLTRPAAQIEPIATGVALLLAVLATQRRSRGGGLLLARRPAPADAADPTDAVWLPREAVGAVAVAGATLALGGLDVLTNVTLTVAPGECVAVVGPNGSGKTTLLRLLAGVVALDAGEARVTGRISRTLARDAFAESASALDAVTAGAEPGRPPGWIRPALATPRARGEQHAAAGNAGRCLAFVGLAAVAGRAVEELDGRERRLLAIARALAAHPDVLLLDEPGAGLALTAQHEVIDVIRRVQDAGTTIIVVEHNLRLVRALADRVVVLDAGAVIAHGRADDVLADPAVRVAYLGVTEAI